MRVLVLGGTGSIGGPVVRELIRAGHEVVALTRSVASAASVPRIGARPIAGDMATPERWLADLPPLDGVIHAAAGLRRRRRNDRAASAANAVASLTSRSPQHPVHLHGRLLVVWHERRGEGDDRGNAI